MPFLAPAIPAIIGAAGSIGAGLLGGSASGGSSNQLLQTLTQLAQGDANKRDQIIKSTAGPLSYFYNTDPTQSGLYKDFLSTGTQSVADAYNTAKANLAAKANTAGFGYSQPVTQGANAEMANEEAKAQSNVPKEALINTIQPELNALSIRAGEARNYDPQGYFGAGSNLANNVDNQKSGLFSSLFDTATQALNPLIKKIPGVDSSQDTTVSF